MTHYEEERKTNNMNDNRNAKKKAEKAQKKHWRMDKVLLTRIVCGFLAALMLLSVVYTVI